MWRGLHVSRASTCPVVIPARARDATKRDEGSGQGATGFEPTQTRPPMTNPTEHEEIAERGAAGARDRSENPRRGEGPSRLERRARCPARLTRGGQAPRIVRSGSTLHQPSKGHGSTRTLLPTTTFPKHEEIAEWGAAGASDWSGNPRRPRSCFDRRSE